MSIFLKNENTKTVIAQWSGSFPCLCHGKWTLIVNEEDVSDKIPKTLRTSPMDTFGIYHMWSFDSNYREEWEEYEDGLKEDEWIQENKEWLNKISSSEDIQKEIYRAISECDWRHSSCGGCI